MNDLVNFSFQLGIFTVLFFVLGMIKPKWPLFFLKQPTRFIILVVTPILVMITITLYGEGLKREKEEKILKETPAKISNPTPVTAPVPVPVPADDLPPAK